MESSGNPDWTLVACLLGRNSQLCLDSSRKGVSRQKKINFVCHGREKKGERCTRHVFSIPGVDGEKGVCIRWE